MTEVHVPLAQGAYDIKIGPGMLDRAGTLVAPFLSRARVFVISDETVAHLHKDQLIAAMRAEGIEVAMLALPPGEGTKSWPCLMQVLDWLLDGKAERGDLIVAFGGGVIGDLAGFAAAILRRGVRFIQIPTSLLAQVDSSVGGKTGINTAHGKNLIGAFHQPSLVIADTAVLDTMTSRDFLSGYGEVVKYGLLGDAGFFSWLEQHGPDLRRDPGAVAQAVKRSCQMKAEIVARDETEQGERALLNLGHTFGHALEAATGYGDRLLHGEGVAAGCLLAFDLSARLGLCAQELPSRIADHFETMGLRYRLSQIDGLLPDADGLIELMAQDKKVIGGRLRLVLARAIGEAFITDEVPPGALHNVLKDALAARPA